MVDILSQHHENQDEHRKRRTFAEEYEEWARKYGVWDDEDDHEN